MVVLKDVPVRQEQDAFGVPPVRSHFCLEKDDLGSNICNFEYSYCKIKLNMHWELKYLPVQSQSLTVVLHCLLTSILISYCSVCKLRHPPHHTTDPSNDFGE